MICVPQLLIAQEGFHKSWKTVIGPCIWEYFLNHIIDSIFVFLPLIIKKKSGCFKWTAYPAVFQGFVGILDLCPLCVLLGLVLVDDPRAPPHTQFMPVLHWTAENLTSCCHCFPLWHIAEPSCYKVLGLCPGALNCGDLMYGSLCQLLTLL